MRLALALGALGALASWAVLLMASAGRAAGASHASSWDEWIFEEMRKPLNWLIALLMAIFMFLGAVVFSMLAGVS